MYPRSILFATIYLTRMLATASPLATTNLTGNDLLPRQVDCPPCRDKITGQDIPPKKNCPPSVDINHFNGCMVCESTEPCARDDQKWTSSSGGALEKLRELGKVEKVNVKGMGLCCGSYGVVDVCGECDGGEKEGNGEDDKIEVDERCCLRDGVVWICQGCSEANGLEQ